MPKEWKSGIQILGVRMSKHKEATNYGNVHPVVSSCDASVVRSLMACAACEGLRLVRDYEEEREGLSGAQQQRQQIFSACPGALAR